MDNKPLVSICTTFFNAERYIYRLIESCLNQTYENIELVIVDDASTDGSEKAIREYMKRDSRIRYFKNNERIALAESLLEVFKTAKGDLAMMLGADDWLPRHYVENGVNAFLKHPDIAGVVPDLTTLFEYGDKGKFTFSDRKHFSPGLHSSKWFMKRVYRPIVLYISGYALVRSKDLVKAMDYCLKSFYRNPSKSIPEELRGFFRRGFGTDSMLFAEILTRYKNFIFDGSLNYIKISHSQNQLFDFKSSSLFEIFKDKYYYLLIYTYVYKFKWPGFYRGMKIFRGAEALSSAFIYFFRCGLRPSFLNFSESKKLINDFFGEFSFFEVVLAVMYSVPMLVYRCSGFIAKKLFKKDKRKTEESSIFTRENFLNSEKHFESK